jgi:hypothetical protein
MVSINYKNIIKIVRAAFENMAILFLWDPVKDAYFWSYNEQIHRAHTYEG